MSDPILPTAILSGERRDAPHLGAELPPLFDLIELMFFAYRDFTADADRRLEGLGFGRAHHRVLHFVHRHPGLTVAALLDILKITKQSLNRVMKELIGGGFIEVRTGVNDRRRRLLHVTAAGARLALDLAHLHSGRFARALAPLPPEAHPQAVSFLLGMIDADERARVVDLVWGPPQRDAEGERDPRDGPPTPALAPREHAA